MVGLPMRVAAQGQDGRSKGVVMGDMVIQTFK